MMIIEKITHTSDGVFAMTIFNGKANEIFFETESEAIGYVAAFNQFVNA